MKKILLGGKIIKIIILKIIIKFKIKKMQLSNLKTIQIKINNQMKNKLNTRIFLILMRETKYQNYIFDQCKSMKLIKKY